MIEKSKVIAWYARRPSHWWHAASLIKRKFDRKLDCFETKALATEWAEDRSVPLGEALETVGLPSENGTFTMDRSVVSKARGRARDVTVKMGGGGHMDLLFSAARLSGARLVIETGVAYGWSSLAILAGISGRDGSRLISVDMPYPRRYNDPYVGVVVPDEFRGSWELIKQPDRRGIKKAITSMGQKIDLVHYDSDKSYQGRQYGYPLLWSALEKGGVFISDDIQDNTAFREFVEDKGAPFAVTEHEGKHVGIVRKT